MTEERQAKPQNTNSFTTLETKLVLLENEQKRIARRINSIYGAALASLIQLPNIFKYLIVELNSPIYQMIVAYANPYIEGYTAFAIEKTLETKLPAILAKNPNFDATPIVDFWLKHANFESLYDANIAKKFINPNNYYSDVFAADLDISIRAAIMVALSYSYDYYLFPMMLAVQACTFLAKNFLIDKLLLEKLFPAGVFQSRENIALIKKAKSASNPEELKKLILQLEKNLDADREVVKKYKKLSRWILLLFFILKILPEILTQFNESDTSRFQTGWGIWFDEIIGPITLSLTLLALTNLLPDVKEAWVNRSLNNKLENKEKQINQITNQVQQAVTWIAYPDTTLDTSFFEFYANATYKGVKPTHIAEALRYVLFQNKIPIISQGKARITIKASTLPNNCEHLKNEFKNHIERLIKLKTNFSSISQQYQQLFTLLRLPTSCIYRTLDNNKNFNLKIEINTENVSAEDSDLLIKKLKILFPKNAIEEKHSIIHLIGFTPAAAEQFNDVINKLKAEIAVNSTNELGEVFTFYSQQFSQNTQYKRPAKSKTKESTTFKDDKSTTALAKQASELPLIKWPSGVTYDPDDPNGVIPLRASSVPYGRLFGINTADYRNSTIETKHKGILAQGRILGEKEGKKGKKQQGVTRSSGMWTNPKGHSFWAEYEIKSIGTGETGSGRTFGHTAGKTLVNGIERTLIEFDTYSSYH